MRWLMGPEAYWAAMGALCWLAGRINLAAGARGDPLLIQLGCWLLPLLTVPLSFWLLFAALPLGDQSRLALWLRLLLASFVGLNVALLVLIEAIVGIREGALGVWMYGLMVGIALFIACSAALAWVSWRSA
ncbi:MAG: hypothetical protein ACT4QA_13485 [Panacagrimonas sp.]